MQRIFEAPKSKYVWQFKKLKLTYFEIPKTGSSSTKTVLFRLNYELAIDQELNIGGGQLVRFFPDSRVTSFSQDDFLERILIIYRDPIARVKSAYRSIFLGRQKMQGPLSEYFDKHFQSYINSASDDGMLNHHKPMSWFFPSALLTDPRTVFVETADLDNLPNIFGFDLSSIPSQKAKMPHLLNVNKKLGNIDMTDAEITHALGDAFQDDFELFERLKGSS